MLTGHVSGTYDVFMFESPLTSEARQRMGESIRRHRIERGMTQTQLGAAAGLDQSAISKIENGAYELGLSHLLSLALALDAAPYDLCTALGTPPLEAAS